MESLNDLINVLVELERVGATFQWAGTEHVKTNCPFHDDNAPSCEIHVEKKVFKCHAAGCEKTGDFITWLAGKGKTSRAVVVKFLSEYYNVETDKIINANTVERWHAGIWAAGPLLAQLYRRGVTDEMIRQYRLGVEDTRITIPIRNAHNHFVNVLKYLPGATSGKKFIHTRGHAQLRLFPIEQLQYDCVMICGGPIKAIVAAAELNQHGIGAISTTSGEGIWLPKLSEEFKGKQAIVCLDIDQPGRAASNRVCAFLQHSAEWTGELILPLDPDKYPKGDINDWVGEEKQKLHPLIETVQQWEPRYIERWNGQAPIDADLLTATHAAQVGQRVRVTAVVAAMHQSAYSVPREVIIKCTKREPYCTDCPVFVANKPDDAPWVIQPEAPAILDMAGASKDAQHNAIIEAIAIPPQCKVVRFEPVKWYNVENTRVSPQLQITCRNKDRSMQPAFLISENVNGAELNESYVLTGRMHPHPKTQQNTLLISEYETTNDALSTYSLDQQELERLSIFRPTEWNAESIDEKLADIYEDLEANVTRIYDRRDMHLAIDLAFHSPLFLEFDGRSDVKGWVEILIVGDSAQGKSETAKNLVYHYDLGEIVECKNATVAGLLGGLQRIDGQWFCTWGVIPTHDRRLVVLEELKGAPVEVISRLTDMRSRGIAELPKIEKRRAHARTRLVALSNPRSDYRLSTYNYGIEAIRELIGGLEDIRRFDACLLLASEEIAAERINELQRARPNVAHTYTGELCRSLVLWAWTRERGYFEPQAVAAVLDNATELCKEFTDDIPIIDRGSMRNKLARLSAGLAGRTFSSDDRGEMLVRSAHVEYVTGWLRAIYSAEAFGYKRYSLTLIDTNTLIEPEAITREINAIPFATEFVRHILAANTIELSDIVDWCSFDRMDAQELLSFLLRKHALKRISRGYRKTPSFIEFLKTIKVIDPVAPKHARRKEY